MSAHGVEAWVPITGCPGYEVSSRGQVRSHRKHRGDCGPRIMKPRGGGSGGPPYLRVNLRTESGVYGTFQVHRLVAEAFIGPLPSGQHTRHLDGDYLNNSVENLAYGTPLENAGDRVLHGTNRWGHRKLFCDNGHRFTPENTYIRPGTNHRACHTCRRLWRLAARERRAS